MKAPTAALLASSLAVFLCTTTALADTCAVPSAPHPTIQSAVDDLICTEVVLAAQTFVEAVSVTRDLTLRGAPSTTTVIEGRILVEGATTQVAMQDLKIDGSAPSTAGCYPVALVARGGAQVDVNDVVVLNASGEACVIFQDGFESGDTGQWSRTVP